MSSNSTVDVGAAEVGVYNIALTAGQVDTVTFSPRANSVEVLSNGASELYFTTDGSTPTLGGKKCYILPAGVLSIRTVGTASAPTVIKLLSASATVYSVSKAQ